MPRIMVVDDDPAWRSLYRMALESQFEVFEAMDGHQALKVMDAVHPDVILLDLRMPKMDGIEFLYRLDRKGKRPPIIVSSGTFEEGDRPMIPGVYLAAKTPDLRDVWDALRAAVPKAVEAAAPSARQTESQSADVWRD